MTPEQFDVIARLLQSRGGRAEQAARLVLLDNVAPSAAAEQVGVGRSAVSDTVGRYRAAFALIESAWGQG